MDTTEAKAKVEEIQRWNQANTTYRYRQLRSGLGACDEKRQVYLQREVTTGVAPPPQPSVKPHWERGSAGTLTYVDEKGQRWRFAETFDAGLQRWTLDWSRLPKKEQKGVLTQIVAYYTNAEGKTMVQVGQMISEAPQTDPRAPRQRQQNDPCQYNPMLYHCLPK